MSVQVEILVRVVGSTSEPKRLITMGVPSDRTTPESPFGNIPVSKDDIAIACETAAERLRERA